jgi:hypothetical protein
MIHLHKKIEVEDETTRSEYFAIRRIVATIKRFSKINRLRVIGWLREAIEELEDK